MKKQQTNSQNSSVGFNRTQVFEQKAEQSNPFEKTLKSMNTDRKALIQNFLDANANSNLEQHPHNQRVFTKTITVEAKVDEIKFDNIPGVLQQKKFNYGNVYNERSKKNPYVIIQSLVRRFLAKKLVNERKKYFQKLLKEDQKITIVDKWVNDEKNWAQSVISKLKVQPKQKNQERKTISGLDKNNPFYNTQIEIMGEMGVLEKEDFIEINPATAFANPAIPITEDIKIKKPPLTRIRPKSAYQSQVKPKTMPIQLPNDNCQIWKALYKKKYGRESLHDLSMKEIKITDDYIKIENQEAVRDKARINKINKILEKEVPKELKVQKQKQTTSKKKQLEDSIEDEVQSEQVQSEIADEVEEEIPEEEDIEEAVEEEGVVEEIDDIQSSQIKEESIVQESSVIRESIPSAQKSSKIIKESIQEDYGDDFEVEESQKIKTQQSQYEDDQFDSYHSQIEGDTHRRKATPKSISDKAVISPQTFVPEVKSIPIEIDPGWTTKRANQEAEILLKNYREKYSQLREVEINDEDFEPLKQEHRDLKFIQQQVNNLISHTGDFYKGWKDAVNPQPSQSADKLYAQFQYEFQRLLSMNSLGTRFSKILSQTIVKDVPVGNVKNIMSGIEQQMSIVQQVLENLLFQVQQIFDFKQTMEEMRLYRKEMDQKLQWLLFKQDKLINNQLGKQLEERDKDLKKFIAALFEKQRLEFGSRKLAATVDPHSLSEALLKNQGLLSYKFEQSAQSKKDSSYGKQRDKRSAKEESYYQADFEGEESERIKTEKSDQNIYEQSYKNSLTEDREVEDGSQQSDIDWQTDINLFENTQNSFVDKKDLDVQQIVEYLQEQLLKEILGDPFPIRGQLQNSQVKNESNISSQYSQSFEEESLSASKEIVPEPKQPPPLAVKPIQTKEKVDDFGMGKSAINRDELSKEFDLSENSQFLEKSENKEEGKEVKLVTDFRYQNFVKQILDKYGKVLEGKEKQIITKFQQIVKKYKQDKKKALGYLFSTEFKFIDQKQVNEQNAFQIVQSLEEQLCEQLLKEYNDGSKLDIKSAIEQAKVLVLKITEKRIPVDAFSSSYNFQEIYNHAQRKPPAKECPINQELADVYINEEMDKFGNEATQYILKQIAKNTLADFDKILLKKKK
ncbi:unnamed protein product [Paramecium pentaurelia]|uniref:Uncharacterized protein n=1 Tax=Paramecium pentaurelia TaxID=43138 RepID=A0A8S1VUB1_9CILI|nr:unnamed protein product [Paramecium pentaurelia]